MPASSRTPRRISWLSAAWISALIGGRVPARRKERVACPRASPRTAAGSAAIESHPRFPRNPRRGRILPPEFVEHPQPPAKDDSRPTVPGSAPTPAGRSCHIRPLLERRLDRPGELGELGYQKDAGTCHWTNHRASARRSPPMIEWMVSGNPALVHSAGCGKKRPALGGGALGATGRRDIHLCICGSVGGRWVLSCTAGTEPRQSGQRHMGGAEPDQKGCCDRLAGEASRRRGR